MGQCHVMCDACTGVHKGGAAWHCKTDNVDLCDSCKISHEKSGKCNIVSYVSKFRENLNENPNVEKEIECPISFLRDVGNAGQDKAWILGSRSEDIKLVDYNGKEIRSVKLSKQPLRLAVSHDRKSIYLTVIGENSILKIDAKSGKIKRLFSSEDYDPIAVGACKSGEILVCLYNSKDTAGKVVKYSESGKVILEIEYDQYKRRVYTKPAYIIENANGGICVSDYNRHEVILMTKNGEHEFTYDGNKAREIVEKFTPEGIAADSRGNYLVADYWNNTIHVIKENGAFVCCLSLGKIATPTGITVDDKDRIWVCEFGTDSGRIKVIPYLQ